jgi:hypothetical protein
MKCYWIVENMTHESSYDELMKEIKTQGHPLKTIMKGFKYSDLDDIRSDSPVIFLGSIEMTEMVKKHLDMCFPVAFCTPENYLCRNYMSHFGKYLFNDKYAMVSLAELQRQKWFYYAQFGKEAMVFIRPDSGQKPFQARLIDLLDFDRFVTANDEVKHNLVVVSTPKTIVGEWRYVVTKDQEIIAMSTYRYQGQITRIPSAPEKATKLVEELLKVGYYPDTVFCIDICEDNDGNYWLLEINSFSSAGLYACKKDLIVKRVSEISEKEYSSLAQ